MAALSIRNLDDDVRERLRVRAASHGRSTEAEIRAILTEAVRPPENEEGLAQAIIRCFAEVGGVDLELPVRAPVPPPLDFAE